LPSARGLLVSTDCAVESISLYVSNIAKIAKQTHTNFTTPIVVLVRSYDNNVRSYDNI